MEIWIALTNAEWDALQQYKAAKIASGDWQELKKPPTYPHGKSG